MFADDEELHVSTSRDGPFTPRPWGQTDPASVFRMGMATYGSDRSAEQSRRLILFAAALGLTVRDPELLTELDPAERDNVDKIRGLLMPQDARGSGSGARVPMRERPQGPRSRPLRRP
jgi:hypothetical protein